MLPLALVGGSGLGVNRMLALGILVAVVRVRCEAEGLRRGRSSIDV